MTTLHLLRERLDLYEKLMRLDKPIGTLLLLWPTLWALWLSSAGRPDWMLVWVFALGTLLMRSAGCVINDFADRDFDKHVERTRERPLTTGQVSSREALALFSLLCLASFALVLLLRKPLLIWLSCAAFFLAATYPLTKRFFAIPQAYLGVAFGFGIPMAYAAQLGEVPAQLVVERAVYADANRERWAAGSNALGTPLVSDRVIKITAQGVTPRILVVAPGEQVTIRNLDTVPHQIFSGPYLERSACPALNQVGYLAPGQSRVSGNFTTGAVCPFLDDVRPGQQLERDFQGFVIVK